jgi:hypothetical protein
MKHQKSLKIISQKLFFVAFILLLLPCFAFGASTTLPDTKVKTSPESLQKAKREPRVLESQGAKIVGPKMTKPVMRSAQITRLWVATEPSGKWYWEVTIKNTGNVELEGNLVAVQGYKASSAQAQNNWTGASGKLIGFPNLLPNQSRTIKMRWNRCCSTDQLRVDVKDNKTNKILDTKTEASIKYSPYVPVNVDIKRIEWDNATGSWRAIIKNFTWYNLRLSIQGYFFTGAGGSLQPAGSDIITIGPNAEVTTAWTNTGGSQVVGNTFIVYWVMSENPCNENKDICGGRRQITLPNSKSFF